MAKKAEDKVTERIGLPVTKELKEQVAKVAKQERRSLANQVRYILEEYIKQHPVD